MNLRRVAIGAVVALAAAIGPTGQAAAQDGSPTPPSPEQITRHCVHSIGLAKQRGIEALAKSCEETVALIRRMDQAGAPDALIRGAGRRGVERLEAIARATGARINSIAEECVLALRRIGAPRHFAGLIQLARRESLSMIPTAVERATHKIRAAVAAATGDAPPTPG